MIDLHGWFNCKTHVDKLGIIYNIFNIYILIKLKELKFNEMN